MKKVPKSLQAILITIIIGMLLPNLITLSGNIFFDKIVWKIVTTSVFSVSTALVGLLYASKLLKGKTSGGKARITIYLLLLIMMCSIGLPFLVAFAQTVQWIIYLAIGIVTLALSSLIVVTICKIISRLIAFKDSQEKSAKSSNNINKDLLQNNSYFLSGDVIEKEERIKVLQQKAILKATQPKEDFEVYSLNELWNGRDLSKKCLTATNDENKDLKWVKIYKPPYGNGRFYGYILMNNAHNTVNGEIFFSEDKIWRAIE